MSAGDADRLVLEGHAGAGAHGLGTSGVLDPAFVHAVARRTAEILADEVVPQLLERALQRARTKLQAQEWLTQGEAAALAGVARSTIRAWQAAGRLSKGARARVRRAELEQLLAGGTGAPSAPPVTSIRDVKVRRAVAEILRGGRGGR